MTPYILFTAKDSLKRKIIWESVDTIGNNKRIGSIVPGETLFIILEPPKETDDDFGNSGYMMKIMCITICAIGYLFFSEENMHYYNFKEVENTPE